MTFDVEDWFHILDLDLTSTESKWQNYVPRIQSGVDQLIKICHDHNVKATFFCLGWIADRFPDIVKKIDANGFDIGSHSHLHQLVYPQKPAHFREDLRRSIGTIEQIIGKKVVAYRAPGFSIVKGMPWVFEELVEAGIQFDSSIFPAYRGHGGFRLFGSNQPTLIRTESGYIKEFPINTNMTLGFPIVFSGGGYFRLYPYQIIKMLTRRSKYTMAYFHPRDFDYDQPRLRMPASRYFKSYFGLKSTESKLHRWLSEFSFIDLKMANNAIDWRLVAETQLR